MPDTIYILARWMNEDDGFVPIFASFDKQAVEFERSHFLHVLDYDFRIYEVSLV